MGLAPVDLLCTLADDWGSLRLDTASYVATAEPLARSIAASGDPTDAKRLAVLLNIKGSWLRDIGREAEAVDAEAECIKSLDALADRGDDNALQLLSVFSPRVSPYALGLAAGQRFYEAAPAGPPAMSVLPPLDMSPITRRERVRWWCEDRWEDVRAWCRDPVWEARMLWWSISDRVRFGRKGH